MAGAPEDLSPSRAAELLRDGAQGVDVREQYERDAGQIADTLHIELDQLTAQAEQARPRAADRLLLPLGQQVGACRAGVRAAGFEAHNLDGGLKAWVKGGLPIEPADGHVA